MFTPVGFNVFVALSSRTFGDRTEGGVPNIFHQLTNTMGLEFSKKIQSFCN